MKNLLIVFGLLLSLTGYSQEIISDSTFRPTKTGRRILSDVGDGVLNAQEKTGNSQVYGTRTFTSVAEMRRFINPRPGVQYWLSQKDRQGWFEYLPANVTADDEGALTIVTTNGKRFRRISDSFYPARIFGLIGDGAFDNTAAFNKAIEIVSANGGGVIFFPGGTYLTGTFLLRKNVTLMGVGAWGTIIKMKAGNNDDLIHVYNADGSGLINLYLDGNKAANTVGDVIELKGLVAGLPEGRNRQARFEKLKIVNAPENGVRAYYGTWQFSFTDCKVDYSEGYALYSGGVTDSHFINFEGNENAKGGIYESGGNNHYVGGKIIFSGWKNPGSAAITFDGAARCLMMGMEVQDNYYHGFVINNSTQINLTQVLADGNGAAARSANVNHPSPLDATFKGYAFKVTGSNNVYISGTATNYIQPTGQVAGRYIENSREVDYQVMETELSEPGIQTGVSEVVNRKSALTTYNKASYHTGSVTVNDWHTICRIKSDSSETALHYYSVSGTLTLGNNFGAGSIRRVPFQVTYRGKNASGQTEAVSMYLSASEDVIRVVRMATNSYEIQIKPAIANYFLGYEIFRSGNTSAGYNDGVFPYPAVSSTSGTVALTRLNALSNPDQQESLLNKSTSTTLGTSNTLYPSQNAVKTYVDAKKAAASADAATAVGTAYSQTEVQAILNELRDLKAKMRTAGLLSN